MMTLQDVSVMLAEQFSLLRNNISNAISATGQKASGKTQASLVVEAVTPLHLVLYGRQAFGTLEHGRRPGGVPRNFEGIIRQWILDKGISVRAIPYVRKPSGKWKPKYSPQERGLRAMAGAIAHTIRERGTSLYRAGGRADVYSPYIEQTVKAINERLGLGLVSDFRSIKINK